MRIFFWDRGGLDFFCVYMLLGNLQSCVCCGVWGYVLKGKRIVWVDWLRTVTVLWLICVLGLGLFRVISFFG